MSRKILLATVAAVAFASASAHAGNVPFGGDDFGWIPPAGSATAKAELHFGKLGYPLITALTKCHAGAATGKLDSAAEDACETAAINKAVGGAAKLKSPPSCLNMPTTAGIIKASLDGTSKLTYCDSTSGVHLGSDDTGWVPVAKSATAKAEIAADKIVLKFLVAVGKKCEDARAAGKIADSAAEEACEDAELAKAATAASKLKKPPACLHMADVLASQLALQEIGNGLSYCASPSGAFLDTSTGF